MCKLFFGSVAEQIFRQADCPVLTVGPHSNKHPWVDTSFTERTFRFATDFGPASFHGLPQAVAVANQFRCRLAFLTVIPAIPSSQHKGWRTVADLSKFSPSKKLLVALSSFLLAAIGLHVSCQEIVRGNLLTLHAVSSKGVRENDQC
jgi:hypothetical protein